MYIVIFFSLIALLFTYLEQKGKMHNGMLWGFVLLFAIAALRYNYGSDYKAYLMIYLDTVQENITLQDLLRNETQFEPGWIFLNHVFKYFGGFFALSAFVALVENVVYYIFIRRFVPKDIMVFAVFIYIFSTNYYLLNMSMMRQGSAIALFIWAFSFIKDRRIIPSLLLIGIAWTIHKSAMVLIPFILLPYAMRSKKFSSLMAVAIGVLFILLFSNNGLTQSIYEEAMVFEDVEEYTNTYTPNNVNVKYGIGFIVNLIPFILLLYFLMKSNKATLEQRMMAVMATMSTMVIPFGQIIPTVGRIGMYFGVFSIAIIPIVFKWLPNKNVALVAKTLYILMILYSYWGFFNSDLWHSTYSVYHTIFEAL